jgi:hypothetical protein
MKPITPPVFRSRLRPLTILDYERMTAAQLQRREAEEERERQEWDEEQRRQKANPKGEHPVTEDTIGAARELHGMLRRMAGKNCDQYPETSGGEVVILGSQSYAVLSNDAGETVAVYHVTGPATAQQYKHIALSDWRTLTDTYRRRIEDAR